MANKKVFVSGCYDLLHSGHVEFFRQAAEYGDLYVGIGSDNTILKYKNHQTVYKEQERLFMVKSIPSNQGDSPTLTLAIRASRKRTLLF